MPRWSNATPRSLIDRAEELRAYGGIRHPWVASVLDFVRPPACSHAFAGTTAEESSMCLAMQAEFRFLESATWQIETGESEHASKLGKAVLPLLYSADMTKTQRAE